MSAHEGQDFMAALFEDDLFKRIFLNNNFWILN